MDKWLIRGKVSAKKNSADKDEDEQVSKKLAYYCDCAFAAVERSRYFIK